MARKKMVTITTTEARINPLCTGHVTLFISASTAIKKSANRGQLTTSIAEPEPGEQDPGGDSDGISVGSGRRSVASIAYNRQAPSATITQIASAVNWRTIRP